MQSRLSWKDLRDQRRKENFVGRQEQLRVFSENFVGEVPNYMVFSVTGEGGVGKSTLLQQFANTATATNINAIIVTCDDKYLSPASAMGHIAGELAKLDIKHKDFDERYKKYRELREEIGKRS
jgi:predicted ATP-dependent serine protease